MQIVASSQIIEMDNVQYFQGSRILGGDVSVSVSFKEALNAGFRKE